MANSFGRLVAVVLVFVSPRLEPALEVDELEEEEEEDDLDGDGEKEFEKPLILSLQATLTCVAFANIFLSAQSFGLVLGPAAIRLPCRRRCCFGDHDLETPLAKFK